MGASTASRALIPGGGRGGREAQCQTAGHQQKGWVGSPSWMMKLREIVAADFPPSRNAEGFSHFSHGIVRLQPADFAQAGCANV